MRVLQFCGLALGAGCACVGALAQVEWRGYVGFAMSNSYWDFDVQARVFAPVYDWTGGLLSGTQWRAELYGGWEPDSLSPGVIPDGAEGTVRAPASFSKPGYFSRGDMVCVRRAPPPSSTLVWLQVRVWDVGLGTTYEEVVGRGMGGYGQSALFQALGCDVGVSIPEVPRPLVGLQSFGVLPSASEPGGPYQLSLGRVSLQGITLSWSTNASGHVLEWASSLPALTWITVTNVPVTQGERLTVSVESTNTSRFFRLRKP